MDHQETIEMLRKAGLTRTEIERLTRYRKHFLYGEDDRATDDHRRLEFMRWLFRQGKLNDVGSVNE